MPKRPDTSAAFMLAAFVVIGLAGLAIFVLFFAPITVPDGSWLGMSVPVIVLGMLLAGVLGAVAAWLNSRRR
jgi:protein-S-isoprenylcysteine O-methyltransferase Ste14